MNWDLLLCDKRLGMEEYHDDRHHTRSDFQRDYDRLIFSSPFRRLQNKTQVFPLPGSIFVHNRLTHSLEVSSVGRSMGHEIALRLKEKYRKNSWVEKFDNIRDIVAAACLCHDLGNPPFGHSGEKTISTWFSEGPGRVLQESLRLEEWNDFTHFEGNANSFRLLTHQFKGRRVGGMAMTYSSLASIVKYPYSSIYAGNKGKFGFFESEKDCFKRIAEQLGIPSVGKDKYLRHPLVYITEAADDICYQIMDLEDARKLKIIENERVRQLFINFFTPEKQKRLQDSLFKISDPNEQTAYLRSLVINEMVEDCADVFIRNEEKILCGEFEGTLIDNMEERLRLAYKECSDTAWGRIYNSKEVVDIELAGNRILTYLMDTLMEAVLHPEKNYSKLLLNIFPEQYETHSSSLYTRIQGVLDHISGMTDVYALDLFRKLNGHSLPAI